MSDQLQWEYEKPVFESFEEAIQDHKVQLNKLLTIYEELAMTQVLEDGINISYYQHWMAESRKLHRIIVNLKRRQTKARLRSEAEDELQTEAAEDASAKETSSNETAVEEQNDSSVEEPNAVPAE